MKVWYDVSGIYDWKGNFTGVQRVVYNLGKQLHESNVEAGFFIYRNGTFQEVAFSDLELRLTANVAISADQAAAKPLSLGVVQHHVMLGLKEAVRGTPLEPSLRTAYGKLRKSYRNVRHVSEQTPLARYIFDDGDIVVVVDGNWQFGGFVEALRTAKGQVDFKLVHFIHDLTAVRNPAIVNPGADKIIGTYFKDIFPLADRLITISQSTKNDVGWFAKRKRIHIPKVEVLILGDDNVADQESGHAKKPSRAIPEPFVLAVGTIEIRKNYTVLYYAYKLAKERNIAMPHLVIAGKKGWMAEEAYALLCKDNDIKAEISILLGPSDQELTWLYDHCLFTVFPSFYEGWGLPVAESFVHGKACVSSNASSLPEVGGDLAVYASPYDPGAFMHAMAKMAADKAYLQGIEANIKHSYRVRTWEMVAQDFEHILAATAGIKSLY